jgi:CHAT domain-containing protein
VRAIRALSDRLDSLGAELARRGETGTAGGRPATPGALAACLPAEVALVDFLEYRPDPDAWGPRGRPRRLAAFVSRPGRAVVRFELGPSDALEAALSRWRPDSPLSPDADRLGAAAELRRTLWEPLEPALEEAAVVLICPDGPATRIPFAALPGRVPGSYLIEERALAAIAVPQSLLDRPAAAASASPAGSLVAVGDVDFDLGAAPGPATPRAGFVGRRAPFPPLPGTAREVEAIAARWSASHPGAPVTVLRRGEAVEAALRRESARGRYLHLATHGFFLPEPAGSDGNGRGVGSFALSLPGLQGLSPADIGQLPPALRSGLVLAGVNRLFLSPGPAGSTGDDGIWTALEVGESELTGVDLVVLSACETGLGQAAGGEGLLGLQRAFQAAGARAVVASLWRVNDDATRVLMAEFYRNLWARRRGRLDALRAAQLALLRGTLPSPAAPDRGVGALVPNVPPAPARLPPAYWAGFVLSGEWR